MPRAYSVDPRQRLIEAVEAGSSARAAARRLQVSASTAVKWLQRKRERGPNRPKAATLHLKRPWTSDVTGQLSVAP